jgi:hypothetical protein
MAVRNGRQLGERGVTLPLVAVSLMAMLALGALAIDLASLRDARSEAQRVADAIALAGASAFRDFPSNEDWASDSARTRGLDIARANMVRSDTIDVRNPVVTPTTYAWGKVIVTETNQVTLNVIPDSQKVRAWVRHAGVATFFGGMLAKPYGHVQAMAAAWASNAAPTVNCMKPFLIPDMWHESDKAQQDVNDNDYMEPEATGNGNNTTGGEQWLFQPPAMGGDDYYLKYDPSVPNDPDHPQTGYGSGLRNGQGTVGDVGIPLLLKPQTGNNQRQGNSYFTLDGPGTNLRDDIENQCITANVGDAPNLSQGSATGQAKHGIRYLINQDPGATWNPATNQIEGSSYSDWTQSPRVIIVGLMDPTYIMGNSTNTKPDPSVVFNNFARLFLQDSPGNTDNIEGIFLGPAPGGGGSTTPGTMVKVLQLIQ